MVKMRIFVICLLVVDGKVLCIKNEKGDFSFVSGEKDRKKPAYKSMKKIFFEKTGIMINEYKIVGEFYSKEDLIFVYEAKGYTKEGNENCIWFNIENSFPNVLSEIEIKSLEIIRSL